MQFLYSAFSCRSQLKALYILLSLVDLLYLSPAQLPGEYTPAYMLWGATGNLSTIAISVYSQVLIYGWVNRGTIVATRSPRGTVFDEQNDQWLQCRFGRKTSLACTINVTQQMQSYVMQARRKQRVRRTAARTAPCERVNPGELTQREGWLWSLTTWHHGKKVLLCLFLAFSIKAEHIVQNRYVAVKIYHVAKYYPLHCFRTFWSSDYNEQLDSNTYLWDAVLDFSER